MLKSWFNFTNALFLMAILIVSGTIVYSQYIAQQIASKERAAVESWVEAERTILNSTDSVSINLASKIITENKSIPIIETNEQDQPTGNYVNIDETKITADSNYLAQRLQEFKLYSKTPIEVKLKAGDSTAIRYYYGQSKLLREAKWYPIVQLLLVIMFVLIVIYSLRTRYKSGQNQLWASMAKETAHQLGTPVSSLEGWLEILKEKAESKEIANEIAKDINRLQLITDRFGKIGSTPKTELCNPFDRIKQVMDYMKKRSSEQVYFQLNGDDTENLQCLLSPTLFDWVIENLLKNALDAMDGKGSIQITMTQENKQLTILVKDSGKGIPNSQWRKVFQPGFTTKKRGWGIGLSLSKRIIEQYHNGQLFVQSSEIRKGTVFCIQLPL
ncbi:HAMP domain-containing sensor histidine kinase [Sediminibacterium sp.]|uniref:sensor histidine kinase n=1 Tax=Sediminibacterium sp. TaxID=1917865 RepID=UPI0027347B14|nr:HAMP domain-containing sensor histidine kinase [Sediminibacterium sp.]MDP3393991.1 HAMP domain-containing sensor histidine kinase [Sediminibacterium sp.]MDP3566766.1 HAMP domain-containing sensor histidine kinase [Sediminibacterium sp.]